MKMRVAIAGFLHETNTFAPSKARHADFVQGGGYLPMIAGDEILTRGRDVNLAVAGFLDHCDAAGWEPVPLLWTGAIPSAHVEQDAYERIASEIERRLKDAGPVDAILLDLHGAMVAEHLDDGEGALIRRLRAIVGPDVPIAASLDLHGNVTPEMVEHADLLVAFRTYPHVDMARTGQRTAQALEALIAKGGNAAKSFRQLPFLIPIPWQCTMMEPAGSLYGLLDAIEGESIVSASILMGFPAADFEHCCPSIVTYGVDQAAADAAADELERAFLARESDFAGRSYAPEEAVAEATRLAASATRPVIIADTQDNPGAGGDSNTTGMLRALLAAGAERAAIGLIVDPQAAARAHAAGEGASVRLALGGTSGIAGDAPLEAEFQVERLTDGKFRATGPYYGGADMDLGASACLSIGGIRIVVTSHKAQLADREMYRFVGIVPEDQAILVNKSSVHFRADFEPIAEAILVARAPGPMALEPGDLPFTRLRPGIRLAPNGPRFRNEEATRRHAS